MWRSLAWRQGDSFRLALKPPKVAATLLDRRKRDLFSPTQGGLCRAKAATARGPPSRQPATLYIFHYFYYFLFEIS